MLSLRAVFWTSILTKKTKKPKQNDLSNQDLTAMPLFFLILHHLSSTSLFPRVVSPTPRALLRLCLNRAKTQLVTVKTAYSFFEAKRLFSSRTTALKLILAAISFSPVWVVADQLLRVVMLLKCQLRVDCSINFFCSSIPRIKCGFSKLTASTLAAKKYFSMNVKSKG